MKKKITLIAVLAIVIPFLFGSTSYNYSYYGEALHSTPGVNYAQHLNKDIIGIDYGTARDFVVYNDQIYMVAAASRQSEFTDYLIVLDSEFNPIAEMPEKDGKKVGFGAFNLSDSYATKVRILVNELFSEIDEGFKELFNDNVFYPGSVLPLGSKDPFFGVADAVWTIDDESIIAPNGVVINETENELSTKLEVTFTVWGDNEVEDFSEETITFEYDVMVGSKIEGIETTSSVLAPSFEIETFVSMDDVNLILGSEFDSDIYETVEDFIRLNDTFGVSNETLTFEFDNFEVGFKKTFDEEENTVYEDVTFTEIIEDRISSINSSLFNIPYTLNTPTGIDVVDSGIYIADRRNNRILKLNHDYEVLDAFFDIEDSTFEEIAFEPLKVTVDPSERMYVVAHNVFEGIIELDSDGTFDRYTGVNPIKLTAAEALRRLLMTEAQRARLPRFLPTEYTNVALNDKNFIYATARPREENTDNMIQLINPKGVDVLVRNGYHLPMGDVYYIPTRDNYVVDGPSTFVDVAIGKHGMYTVLDQKRSRLFTYDSEGNLLYISGDEGSQSDKFSNGVAINYYNDDLLLLDSSGTMIIYKLTAFGEAVNKAVELHSIGEFEEAAHQWEEVLRLNTNYEIAYNGIGKYNLRNGDYREAMKNFKLGHDKTYYSKAFVAYRNEILKKYFGVIVLGLVVVAAGVPVYINRKKIFKKKGDNT